MRTARNLADRDPLTGFYNHRFLHERLGEEVVRTQRGRRPLSVLMLDLDDFKLVNDTFGHLFGDRVLIWTAELIRSTLRASDIPTRYGGDEFAIILPETNAVEARRAAERILEAFRDRAFVGLGDDVQRGAEVVLRLGGGGIGQRFGDRREVGRGRTHGRGGNACQNLRLDPSRGRFGTPGAGA